MSGQGAVPERMWALMKRREGESYDRVEVDVPTPVGDEVLIKVESVAICGSDIALYKWNDVAKVIASIPFIPGHECTGVVVATGPEASLEIGYRVAIENHFYCGKCFQCCEGRGDICSDMGQYGHGKKTPHGGCSQFTVVSSKYCYRLTTDISPEEAVLLEPLGVAHNAMEQLDVSHQGVLIIGCGPVGLMATMLAKVMGATRIIVADIDQKRSDLAKELGAHISINPSTENVKEVIMRETNGVGIGRICEMSGSDVMVNSQFSLLRKGGVVVQVGLPKKPLHVENVLQDIVFKSLTLRTIHGRRIFHTWQEIERLVAGGKVPVLKTVSHRFPMSQFEEAFQALFDGKACKILMDPQA